MGSRLLANHGKLAARRHRGQQTKKLAKVDLNVFPTLHSNHKPVPVSTCVGERPIAAIDVVWREHFNDEGARLCENRIRQSGPVRADYYLSPAEESDLIGEWHPGESHCLETARCKLPHKVALVNDTTRHGVRP
jgi:hypothetical protein